MRKINMGAGSRWYKEGWEILDNGSGSYRENWKHFGNIWDTQLPSNTYGIIFTSHTLEHIPHFKIEKTIAELNRVLKIGGLLRISVPDLEKAAIAYVNKDIDYFNKDKMHPADHLGFGSLFMNIIVSPGHQTLAINRDFSEIVGSYAHIYSYDFEMLEILLKKWGFGNIIRCEYGKSSIGELQEVNTILYNLKEYSLDDDFAREKLKSNLNAYLTGFDNKPYISLYVEATKIEDVPYDKSKEFYYTKRSRLGDSKLVRIKLFFIKLITTIMDILFNLYKRIKPQQK